MLSRSLRKIAPAIAEATVALHSRLSLADLQQAESKGRSGTLSKDLQQKYQNFLGIPSLDAFHATAKKRPAHRRGRQLIEATDAHDYELVLIRFKPDRKCFSLYLVSNGAIIAENVPLQQADAWEVAQQITQRGCCSTKLVVLSGGIVKGSTSDIKKGHVHEFSTLLNAAGFQIEVCSLLDFVGMDSKLALSESIANSPIQPDSDAEWFANLWNTVSRIMLRLSPSLAPKDAVLHSIVPNATVVPVHIVRGAMGSITAVVGDTATGEDRILRGTLTDVLMKLSSLPKSVIFFPTYHTDRALLLAIRASMQKMHRYCQIVYPSEIPSKTFLNSDCFSSCIRLFWKAMINESGDTFVDTIRRTCGTLVMKRESTQSPRDMAPDRYQQLQRAAQTQGTMVSTWLSTLSSNDTRNLAEKHALATWTSPRKKSVLLVTWVATNHAGFGRPKNPFSPLNRIIAARFDDLSKPHDNAAWTSPSLFSSRDQFQFPALDNVDVIVAHNAKHLLCMSWHDTELQTFLQRGGRVWCTSLAQYFLSAQRDTTEKLTLQHIAIQCGFVSKVSLSQLPESPVQGEQSLECYDDVLAYLTSSALVMRHAFAFQTQEAMSKCQLISLTHRMDAQVAFAAMEVNGLHVDNVVAKDAAHKNMNDLISINQALLPFVPKQIPCDSTRMFDWTNAQHLRSYFLGGTINVGGVQRTPTVEWARNLLSLCASNNALEAMSQSRWVDFYLRGVPQVKDISGLSELLLKGEHPPSFRLVVFDVESTGLNVDSDEIVEIAFFDPLEGTSFATIVNPLRRIPVETIDIHHITQEMADASESMATVAPNAADFLRLSPHTRRPGETLILMSHNTFSLDEPLLVRSMQAHCPEANIQDVLFLDSVHLLKGIRGCIRGDSDLKRALHESLRLGQLARALGASVAGPHHRAASDAELLWDVVRIAVQQPKGTAPSTVCGTILLTATNLVKQSPSLAIPFLAADKPPMQVRIPARIKLPRTKRSVSQLEKLNTLATDKLIDEIDSMFNLKETGLLKQRITMEKSVSSLLHLSRDKSRLNCVHPDGKIHQLIDTTSTKTTRTTSSFPCCHSIAKSDKSSIRKILTSRFGNRGICIEIDFSQLEIVVMALLCNDVALVKELNSGVDFHAIRASQFSKYTYEEIVEGHSKGIEKFSALRNTAKTFSFQRLYGAGAHLLHKTTGISLENIRTMIQSEERRYPKMAEFNKLVRAVALRPDNPGIPTHFVFELPTGMRVSFSVRDCVHNLPPLKNYPIQGYGAEIVQAMLARVHRVFLQSNNYAGKAFLVNFVHDSLWLDVAEDVASQVVKETIQLLTSVHTYVPTVFPGVEINVPLGCSCMSGPNMFSMVKFNRRK